MTQQPRFLVGWALGHKDADILMACEHGINVNLGRKHTFECRQTMLPSLVTDSLWTAKFDADGRVLKRDEHEHLTTQIQNACDSPQTA